MPKGIGYGPRPKPPTRNPAELARRKRALERMKKSPSRKSRMGMKVTPIRRKVVTKRPRRM